MYKDMAEKLRINSYWSSVLQHKELNFANNLDEPRSKSFLESSDESPAWLSP
jgi:hypothetical protein